jgi:hypothetical protein
MSELNRKTEKKTPQGAEEVSFVFFFSKGFDQSTKKWGFDSGSNSW